MDLNRHHFKLFPSKTKYDLYKYKLKSVPISYSKRKVYRYQVHEEVYDLMTENTYKFLFKVLLSKEDFKEFKETDLWERTLGDLNLYSIVMDHINGIIHSAGFAEIHLADLISTNCPLTQRAPKLKLTVDWFLDENKVPEENEVYLVIFDN